MVEGPETGVGMFSKSRSLEAGETATRIVGGHPNRFFSNWLEHVDKQSEICNPERILSVSLAKMRDGCTITCSAEPATRMLALPAGVPSISDG